MPSKESPIHGHATLATYSLSSFHKSSMVRPPSPHVSYQSSTSHRWSGTLTNCYLSSIHKSSMVQATLLPHVAYQPPQIIYGSGTLLPLVSFSSIHKSSNGSGTVVFCLLLIIHPRVIYGSRTLVLSILVVCSSSIHFTLPLRPLLPSPSFLRFSVFQQQTGQTHTHSA